MIEYLKYLLDDLERVEVNKNILSCKQKIFALKTAINILEDIKYKERRTENGKK